MPEHPDRNVAALLEALPDLETERLLLRQMTLDDAADMYEYGSDPEMTRFTSWETHRSIDDARAFLQREVSGFEDQIGGSWGIVYNADGKFIGAIGFSLRQPGCQVQEIGFHIARGYWGQGLMTECARAVIRFSFENLGVNRIQATCEPENIASTRVLEKCGMSYEGTLRDWQYSRGRWLDMRMYSVLRREFNGSELDHLAAR